MNENQLLDTGQRIRQCRENCHYSQTQLAKKVGMNRSTIANYEAGSISPSIEVLKNIAVTLRTTADYLLCLDHRNILVLDRLTPEQFSAAKKILETLESEWKTLEIQTERRIKRELNSK